MKLNYWKNKDGDMEQYIAWYDDEYILCIDISDGEIDTYNVLDAEDFEDMTLSTILYNEEICKVFLKFLFTLGFDGGNLSDIA